MKLLAIIAALAFQLVLAVSIMVWFVDAELSDRMLIAVSTLCSLAVVAWAVAGARAVPKWLGMLTFLPCMMFGICLSEAASERYPPFAAWTTGAVAVAVFVAIGCAISWRFVGTSDAPMSDSISRYRLRGTMGSVILALGFAGALFFRPLVILANAQGETQRPMILSGAVTRAYRTHGRGAADYIDLAGPAAAYSTTWTKGEFEVDGTTFRQSPVGARKCLTVRTGLLRLRWWSIADCP